MKWYNPEEAPFRISGFAFYKYDGKYRRMPLKPKYELPLAVDRLANETSGGQIRFHAKFKTLKIAVTLDEKNIQIKKENHIKYPHISLTNAVGFDLYFSTGGEYKFFGVTKNYDGEDKYYEYTFLDEDSELEIDVLLNFPLYGSVEKILIGFDDDAVVTAPQRQFSDDRNLVFYGGSIEQGACASRPGMNEVNILSRWFNMEVFNMGFDGSGKAEESVAHTIASIKNTAALVISTEGNCPDDKWMYDHLTRFINIFRKEHPHIPIVVMPFASSASEEILPYIKEKKAQKRIAQATIVSDFKRNGDKNIYLFKQNDVIEKEFDGNSIWHEYNVDGTHKTDLAYMATAKGLYRFIKSLI